MQLFHIDIEKVRVKWNNIELFSIPELLSQLRKVLRIKKWDKICIQFSDNKWTVRYEISIQDWADKDLTGEIISSQAFSFSAKQTRKSWTNCAKIDWDLSEKNLLLGKWT